MTIGPSTGYSTPYGYPQLFHPSSRISLDATDDYPSFSSDEAETLSFQSTQDPTDRAPLFRMGHTDDENPYEGASLDPQDAQRHSRHLSPQPGERFLTPSSQLEGSQAGSFVSATAQQDSTTYVRYALDQMASQRSHVARPADRPLSESTMSDYSLPPPVPDHGLGYRRMLSPSPPLRPSPERRVSPLMQGSLLSPAQTVSPQTIPESEEDVSLKDDMPQFIPCEAPEASFKHQRLKYKPLMLRLPILAGYIIIALLAGGLLIWAGIKSMQGNGVEIYDEHSASQYFLFRILPQFLAGLYLLALQPIEAALTRVAPFLAMTSSREHVRSRAHSMPLYSSNYLFPRLAYFFDGLFVVGVVNLVLWMSLFTVPLFSALFEIRLIVGSNSLVSAHWAANQVVAYFLAALYILLAVTLLSLGVFFIVKDAGLKWFPSTIADLVVLIRQSNLARDFTGTELLSSRSVIRSKLQVRSDRLGYWRTEDQSKDIFYAIAEEGEAPRRFSVLRGKTLEKAANESSIWGFVAHARPRPRSDATGSTRTGNIHSPFVRFAYIPWYLTDSAVVSWAIIGILLWVALITISFVKRALLKGFAPSLSFETTPAGFSRAGFFYSFIPSLLGMIIYLAWRSVDTTFRALQPWANLANRNGATAKETLLLDYTQDAPLVVTAKAALAGHWRVAIFSFNTVLSLFIAILAGGIFQPILDLTYNSQALVRTNVPALGAMLAFLTLTVIALPTIFPTRKRYLPHAVQTTGEVISFIYASPLLDDRPFRDPPTRAEMVEGLAKPLTGDGPLGGFAFGVFKGRDGKEHLGVDRIWRDDPGEV